MTSKNHASEVDPLSPLYNIFVRHAMHMQSKIRRSPHHGQRLGWVPQDESFWQLRGKIDPISPANAVAVFSRCISQTDCAASFVPTASELLLYVSTAGTDSQIAQLTQSLQVLWTVLMSTSLEEARKSLSCIALGYDLERILQAFDAQWEQHKNAFDQSHVPIDDRNHDLVLFLETFAKVKTTPRSDKGAIIELLRTAYNFQGGITISKWSKIARKKAGVHEARAWLYDIFLPLAAVQGLCEEACFKNIADEPDEQQSILRALMKFPLKVEIVRCATQTATIPSYVFAPSWLEQKFRDQHKENGNTFGPEETKYLKSFISAAGREFKKESASAEDPMCLRVLTHPEFALYSHLSTLGVRPIGDLPQIGTSASTCYACFNVIRILASSSRKKSQWIEEPTHFALTHWKGPEKLGENGIQDMQWRFLEIIGQHITSVVRAEKQHDSLRPQTETIPSKRSLAIYSWD
ncbi:hypothetical protein EIP91_002889 [Steccherinum ochraceum]|uniref:Uncharacterized protein n=1 Tax=Steccherinum ochraceum TaxID=92696 RepID=A0A4R0RT69_9APHY|nr:hypothetical protein EIP91_002889 [Steccherinum ochraceum]